MIAFGPGGNSQRFYDEGYKSSVEMPEWLAKKGLNAYEYQCSKGVKISEKTARKIGEKAKEYHVKLSVHAPYYINLASDEERIREHSIMHIHKSLQVAQYMGASRVVVHPGSIGKTTRSCALEKAIALFQRVILSADEKGLLSDCTICPELMGKINQLGDLEEVLQLCRVDDRILPTIDFGHFHARTLGGLLSEDDYHRVMDVIENALGLERARKMHIHFSRIEFTKGGEKKHWNFADQQYGPHFMHFAPVLVARKMEPTIICESTSQMVEDAIEMKQMFEHNWARKRAHEHL